MYLYSVPAILALSLLLIINFELLFNRHYVARSKKALIFYRLFIITLAGYYVCDLLWGVFDALQMKTALTIDTNFYFLFVSALLLAWSNFVVRYIEDKSIFRIIVKVTGYLIAALGIALVIANFFTPILFSIDSNNNYIYNARIGRYLFFGFQFLVFVFIAIYAFVVSYRRTGVRRVTYRTLGFFGLAMAGGITLSLYFPLYPVYTCVTAVSGIILHMFLVNIEKIANKQALVDAKAREQEHIQIIEETKELAYIDPLTGVKNKHAFVELEKEIDELIHDEKAADFALIIFDLNNLKDINDKYGHDTGDIYIKKSCAIISDVFANNTIYRYGGDEFVVLLKGDDYVNRYQKIEQFNTIIEKNIGIEGEPVVALGFADFTRSRDNTLRSIFIRADEVMYNRKRKLKSMANDAVETESNHAHSVKSILNLRLDMYEMFYQSKLVSLIDMLNASSCDEILEIDVVHDSFKQFFHVDNKYFVPAIEELSYRQLKDFTSEHIVHPDDRGIYDSLMNIDGFFERLKNARIPNFDIAHFRYKLQDGKYRYVEQAVITGEEYGIPEGMFRMYVSDIENIKSRQLGIVGDDSGVISVGRDPITGLLVGKDFYSKAEECIKENKDIKWCLVSLDIEHFKFFDEWFGRDSGDLLLAKIGAELSETKAREGGVAGYFGADDFTYLCEYNEEKIKALYDRIHDAVNSFGLSTGFTPAFGVALIEEGMILVDAFDRSTIAIASAKSDLKNRIYVYSPDMQSQADHEYRILTEFIHALQEDEITFFLQPQCRISTGTFIGAEALARWIKKDGTVVPPGVFVPVLEKYGFVTDLDKVIWEKVVKWLSERKAAGLKSVPVSVNVSRIDVINLDVAGYFKELCAKYKLPHNAIKLEITESAYADAAAAMDVLIKKLHADGFLIMMDDFGSGYSSLNMLSNMKLDAIKLDANFLHMKNSDQERGIHILESVINMAITMALPIIVEGAELKNQVDFLKELGCQYIQGYYFYKPMSIQDFEALIADGKLIDKQGLVTKLNEQFRIREFLDENIYSDSMLNEIIGSVAIYSLRKNHVDIVRFNQQFFESVNVPDFTERLENIEQFLPEEDRPLLFNALKAAKQNKLTGSSQLLRFFRSDGTLLMFNIHFYYIGKKEGTDRFYGSAENETELANLQDNMKLFAKYSKDNLIFVSRIYNNWHYIVASHSLSEELGLSPLELEEELNSGKFAKRITPQKDIKEFMKLVNSTFENETHYEHVFTLYRNDRKKVSIKIMIDYVGNETNNIKFIIRTELVKK